MSENENNQADGAVRRVGTRVPPFYVNNPELWFTQLEAQFVISAITADATKYYYVLAHLESRYAEEVLDVIRNPPSTRRYELLRSTLIQRLSASHEAKIRQLLGREEIGDRKPSQFLRHLTRLAGASVPKDLLRTIWVDRLPKGMQAILATQEDGELDKIAQLADKVYDTNPSMQVVSTATSDTIAELRSCIESLTGKVEELSRGRGRGRERGQGRERGRVWRGRSQSRQRSKSRNSNRGTQSEECWFHQTYGDEARRCRSPCSRRSGNETPRR